MNQTTLYGIAIDGSDEEDQEYIPQKEDITVEKQIKKQRKKEKQTLKRREKVARIWSEMCQETQPQQTTTKTETTCQWDDALRIASAVLDKQKAQSGKKVKFAGKEFYVNEQGEVREQIEEKVEVPEKQNAQHLSVDELKGAWKYFHNVIRKIQSKAKNINSIVKSKLDWNEYKVKEKMEDRLDQHRKGGGLLEKQRFIEKTREKQKLLRRSRQAQQGEQQ